MTTVRASNVLYFEGASMKELYAAIAAWQRESEQDVRSLHIKSDAGKFCCIAVVGPLIAILYDPSRPEKPVTMPIKRGPNPSPI